jgi:hypothetical protein
MKAIRIYEPKGREGIDGLVYENAPDPSPPSATPSSRCTPPASPPPS